MGYLKAYDSGDFQGERRRHHYPVHNGRAIYIKEMYVNPEGRHCLVDKRLKSCNCFDVSDWIRPLGE